VVVDVGHVPLVRAAVVLVARAGREAVVLVLVVLTGDVGESLVHGHVGHHVLVVRHAAAVREGVGRILSELGVAHTGRAEVEQADLGHAGGVEVQSRQSGHGSAEGVAGHDDRVRRELLTESVDGSDDIGDNRLLGLVEALVDLTLGALVVVSQYNANVINPVFNGSRATVNNVDFRLGRQVANITLMSKKFWTT